ncbi:MAG: hypothetical protein AAB688_00535 [Patescibacteria group bacterium]
MSIKDLLLKIKGKCQNSVFLFKHKAKIAFRADFFTAIVILLVGFAGFGLGRLSALEGKKSPILIERNPLFSSLLNETVPIRDSVSSLGTPTTKSIQNSREKSFVASKTGTKYYFPWCGGVSKIKEENKIWFDSAIKARESGYTPAANCAGLK